MEALKLIINHEEFWIAIIFLSALFFLLWNINRSKDDYIKDLSKALLGSLFSLAIVFGGYNSFRSETGMFHKLVSGEVIVGIAVAFPILLTWYRKDKKEKKEENETKKKQYIYQVYTELKSDYLKLKEDFHKKEMNQILTLVSLEQIIDRIELFERISGSEVDKPNESFEPIDFLSLFVSIQEKLKNLRPEFEISKDPNSLYYSWRILNNKIIHKIKSTAPNYMNFEDVCAIDFNKNSDLLWKYARASSFYGCEFKANDLMQFITVNDGLYIFKDVFLDRKLTSEEISQIKDDIELKSYFYIDEFGSIHKYQTDQEISKEKTVMSTEQKTSKDNQKDLNSAINRKQKNKTQKILADTGGEDEEEYRKPFIYERRDLSDYGPINMFIECGKALDVSINEENSGVKQQIFNILKRVYEKSLNNMSKDNSFISISKNFIPEMKDSDKEKFEWHSWNVLTEKKINDHSISFFIFAIKITEIKFECIVITRKELTELLKLKNKTIDNRYFFYFARLK